MGNFGKKLFCIFILIITVLTFPNVSAQNVNLQYQGEGKPLNDEWPPTISLKLTNGTYIYFYSDKNLSVKDSEPLNLSLSVSAGKSPNGRAIGLFDVSYNASWLQAPIVIYHWNGDPSNFSVWYNNGPQYFLDYNLTLDNIPKGNQQIEFKVISIGMYIGIPYFSSFKKEETLTLELSVANSSNPTPTIPEVPIMAVLPLLIAIISATIIIKLKMLRNKQRLL